MKHWKSVGFVLFVLVLALGLAGCGQKLVEKATEKALEKATNGSVDVDIDKTGGVTVKGDEGEWSLGSQAKVPADFPAIMPLYSGATVISGMKVSDPQASWSVVLQSTDSAAKVYEYYQSQLASKGWTTDSTMDLGDLKTLTVSQSGYTGSVTVSTDDGKTGISLTVSVESE